MPKLRTPVRYGSEIKDIEFTDFLNLTDTVENVIDFPVGVCTPVVDRGKATGKFLRCSDNGTLLARPVRVSENIESISIRLTRDLPLWLFRFAQTVHGCLVTPDEEESVIVFMWSDSTGSFLLKSLSYTESVWIEFTGKDLYLRAVLPVGGYIDCTVRGFY